MTAALLAALALAAQTPVPACSVQVLPCNLSDGLNRAEGIAPTPAPDGRRVVFTHDAIGAPRELYSIPAYGGERPTRISVDGEAVDLVGVSADSARVLYTHSEGTGRNRLFSVPIAGPESARVRLADDVGDQPEIQLSPDGRKVVFLLPAADGLKVVPTDGPVTAGRRLTAPFAPGATATGARISADSKSVVYRSDQATPGTAEVFRVPLTLTPEPVPPTTRINGPLVAGGHVSEFVLAPNAVVYRADEDTVGRRELYRAGLGGGARAKLSASLGPDWDVFGPVEGGGPARILPDGSRVIYELRKFTGGYEAQLHSVPLAGPASASVRLDYPGGQPVSGLAPVNYKLSADSRRVVYTLANDSLTYLLSVPATGPAAASRLLAFPHPDNFVYDISLDGARVAYEQVSDVFSVPIGGGTALKLNGGEDAAGDIRAGAGRFVYEARRANGVRALFSADGAGPRYELSAGLPGPSFIRAFTADGGRLFFTSQQSGAGMPVQLFSTRLAPAVAPPQ